MKMSPLELSHHQSTHTDIFFRQQSFYGMLFLMPSCKSNSLIYSMLLYIVFSFDIGFFVYVVFGCFALYLDITKGDSQKSFIEIENRQ